MNRILVLLMLSAAILAGCKALPPRVPVLPERSAGEVYSLLKSRQPDVTTFQIRGRLTLISPKQNATGNAILKAKLPESLRVDLKDPLGRAVLSFATDGQTMELLFPREGKLFRGAATPTNLAAFIPPGVSLSQALSLLAGKVPLSPAPPEKLTVDSREGNYLLEWLKGDGSPRERLTVAGHDLRPCREEWYGDQGRLIFAAELEGFDPQGSGPAKRLRLLTQDPLVELRLAYQEFTPNISLTPQDLQVPRPPGVREFPLKP